MKYSVGVEYALHCLLYMVDLPAGQAVGIKDLALYQGVSETYLSKVFTRLRKAGLIQAAPGVKGGYRLLAKPEEITFWGVVEAIEGAEPLFQCQEIRQRELLLERMEEMRQTLERLNSKIDRYEQTVAVAEQKLRRE